MGYMGGRRDKFREILSLSMPLKDLPAILFHSMQLNAIHLQYLQAGTGIRGTRQGESNL